MAAFAGNATPADPPVVDKKATEQMEIVAPCYVCTTCNGQVICLVCSCDPEDCADKATLLADILCSISPSCCYVIGSGPK